jgi:uncharacterized repeat protein (TIGR02543 family)
MKKIVFVFFVMLFTITLTACDGTITLPSGVTLPPDITTDEITSDEQLTTDELTTEIVTTQITQDTEAPTATITDELTVLPTTEVPTDVVTTLIPTTDEPTATITDELTVVPTTEEPTTVVPTTDAPTTVVPTTPVPTTSAPTTIREITIIFDSQGGESLTNLVLPETTENPNLPTPSRAGYTFDGWYASLDDTNLFIFSEDLEDQVTVYAKWTPIDYLINYYDIGDIQINDVYNTGAATFIFTEDHHVYGVGLVYLDGTNPWSDFEIIDGYFNLNDGEFIDNIFGHATMYAITSDARIFAWGTNSYGSAGNDSNTQIFQPVEITSNFALLEDETIVQMNNTQNSAYAITSFGRLFTWGFNSNGQLGNGTTDHQWLPVDITDRLNLLEDELVIDMAYGTVHSIILTNQSRVFTVGSNYQGQLGLGYTSSGTTAIQNINSSFTLQTDDQIIGVEASRYSSFVFTALGDVFGFGVDSIGQFGIETYTPVLTPINLTDAYDLAEGEVIAGVKATSNNVFFKTTSGRLLAIGYNNNNSLFVGEEIDRFNIATDIIPYIPYDFQKIVFAYNQTIVFTTDGQLYYIGTNANYESGIGNTFAITEPYQMIIPGSETLLLNQAAFGYETNVTLMVPEKDGYTFIGWFSNPELTDEIILTTMPMEDIDAYAKWALNDYTISFESYGGSDVTDITVPYMSNLSLPTPMREGYTFLGWFEDSGISSPFTKTQMPLGDITLYAGWQINQYTIVFEENGGEALTDLTDDYLSELDLPTPIREGYTFLGWFEDAGVSIAFTDSTMPINGITLYAGWQINRYDIVFKDYDESGDLIISQDYMSQLEAPVDPVKLGHTFIGWFTDINDEAPYVFNTMPEGGITLYPKWQVNSYTISFDPGNGEALQDIVAEYLSEITLPTPIREGYRFLGWYVEGAEPMQKFTETTMPAENITLWALWQVEFYQLTFADYDESGDLVYDLYFEQAIPTPSDPTKEGYTFLGWYEDLNNDSMFTLTTMPSHSITLYPKWAASPATIYFVVEGLDIPPLEAFTGDLFELPQLVLEGKSFIGWFTEDTFINQVFWTEVPVGESTLYGKWEDVLYTITYEENGGTEVLDETHAYLDGLTEPTPPTKDGYIFDGWYIDTAFTMNFIFDQMPSADITLYAKWIDASNPASIINQITQPSGSSVTITGIVYGTMRDGVLGYFVYDSTGYVAIDGDHSTLNIGDSITVDGLLFVEGGIPFITNVSNLAIYGNGLAVPEPIVFDLANLDQLNDQSNLKVYSIGGILVTDQENFFVFDPNTLQYIAINPDSIEPSDAVIFENNLGSAISMDMVYSDFGGFETASIINYQLTSMTVEQQGEILKFMIETHLNLNFFPGDQIPLEVFWMLDDLDLSYYVPQEYAIYYDPINHVFLETDTQVVIPVNFTLDVDSITYDFVIEVTLNPLDISTIAEVIDDTTMSVHTIEALVVMKSEMDMLLKDDSGYLYAYALPQVQVGDIVRLIVINDLTHPIPYLDFMDGDLIYKETLSTGNPLSLTLNQLSSTDFLALDPTDPHIYGQYIELRGFVRLSNSNDYYGFVLQNDEYTVQISSIGHSGFEKLFDYDGLEVYMRGYLVQDMNGNLSIYYEGIRGDIRLPEYTDQEVVDVLVQLFHYHYDGVTFDAFDSLEMMPYHPILGGEIIWSFDDPSFAYYDVDRHEFLYTDQDQPFSMTITVNYNTASETIYYSSQVNQSVITPLSEINQMENYQPAFIKGIVIFHSPEFIYLMDSLGNIIFVEGYQLDVYTGDEVILYGDVNFDYSYDDPVYLQSRFYGEDERMVIDILSRQNIITMPQNIMAVSDLIPITNPQDLNNQIYVTMEGLITYNGSSYQLETPDGILLLEIPYTQVTFELNEHVDEYVSLKGYLRGVKYDYSSQQDIWVMMFVGEPGDIQPIEQTSSEIFDDIESFIGSNYQTSVYSGDIVNFEDAIFFYPNVTLTYTTLDDIDQIFDFGLGYMQTIQDVTQQRDVQIQVDLELGLDTRTFTFTISVLPVDDVVVTDIVSTISDGQTVQNIQGQVIIMVRTDYDQYILMVEDSTGIIFVHLDGSVYESISGYYSGYINKEMLISGTITQNGGRYDMIASAMEVINDDLTENVSFTPITIADYLSIDLTDPATFGVGYELTGKLSFESTAKGNQYYLDDGTNMIRVYFDSVYYNNFTNYAGMMVTIQAFAYGIDADGMMAVLFNINDYNGVSSIRLSGYDDEAGFYLIQEEMINDLNEWNPAHYPGDYIWYPSLPQFIYDAFSPTIVFNVIQGADYVTDNGSYLVVDGAPEDVVLLVEVSVTINSYTNTFVLKYYINGYTPLTLADLFDTTPGTDEIALEAIVINSGFGLHYFLIEDQIYTLRSFAYGGFSKGEDVIILGQRRVIDGVSDYTYNIQIIGQYTSSSLTIPTQTTLIETLYSNDYDLTPLQQSAHAIEGMLDYDSTLGLYTLSDGNHMVYVRMLQEGWDSNDFLAQYLGEIITVNVLLPLEMVRGEAYYIVDALPGVPILLKDYTPEEDVALIKDRLLSLTTLDVYGGDHLYEYLPEEWLLHPYTWIEYTLVNPLDEMYYDVDNEIFGHVNSVTQVQLLATIQYDDFSGTTLSDTLTININIHPRSNTPVLDVIYGKTGEIVLVNGVIVSLQMTSGGSYDYAIISDGNYQIMVDFGDYDYETFDGENMVLALGDEIEVIAERSSYDNNGTVAMLWNPSYVNVLSQNNTITQTPMVMTVEDVLDLSFTDLTNFYQYVTITGELYWDYDYYTPEFTVLSPVSFDRQVDLLQIVDPTLQTTLENLNGQQVEITGYLISYQTLGTLDWVFVYESHVSAAE